LQAIFFRCAIAILRIAQIPSERPWVEAIRCLLLLSLECWITARREISCPVA
jgi:hypothetical protein